MPNKFLSLFILLLSAITLQAQEADSVTSFRKFPYFNALQGGVLTGDEGVGTTPSFTMYHGVRVDRASFALGLGIDQYERWRTVPISFLISYDIIKWDKSAFYIGANAGFSRAHMKFDWQYFENVSTPHGIMANPVLGYRLSLGKVKLYAAAGYKYQRIRYTYTGEYYYEFNGNAHTMARIENLQRIHVTLGAGLF
jgi:hypothetical protein